MMIERRTVASLAMAVGLAIPTAAGDLAGDLRGKWNVDKAAMVEAAAPPFYKMATPEKQKEIREDMLKGMPDMVLEFTAGTVSMKNGEAPAELATYKITKADKTTVWFDVASKKKDGTPQVDKLSAEFVTKDRVKFGKEGEPALVLNRAR